MSQSIINVGNVPNDGTGDVVRTAFIKCNNNFSELYGRQQPNIPGTLVGAAGDQPGMYAFDSSNFYWCFQPYNGISNCWTSTAATSSGGGGGSSIVNGLTSVGIPALNGQIVSTVNNQVIDVLSPTGHSVTGNVDASGWLVGQVISTGTGNLQFRGSNIVNTIGPITIDPLNDGTAAGMVNVLGDISSAGNVYAQNLSIAGAFAAASLTSTSMSTGTLSASTSIAAPTGNFATVLSSNVSVSGPVTATSVTTTGAISGTVVNATTINGSSFVGGLFTGNGSGLTNLPATYFDSNVISVLGGSAGAFALNAGGGAITGVGSGLTGVPWSGLSGATANVQAITTAQMASGTIAAIVAGTISGDGGGLSNIPAGNIVGLYSNANAAAFLASGNSVNILTTGSIGGASLSASGNVTGAFIKGDGGLLSNITGANVVGAVPHANLAVNANTVTDNAQPNITSVGTLNGLSVNGFVIANNFSGSGLNLTNLQWMSILGANSQVGAFLASGADNLNIITTGSVVGNVVRANTVSLGPSNVVLTGNTVGCYGPELVLDPMMDGSPATGNVDVLGNLNVLGNINYNTITFSETSNLAWIAANNAPTAIAATGGGLYVGNAVTPYATWTYNAPANAWQSNIGVNINGNLVASNVTLANLTSGAYYGNADGLSNIKWANIDGANANVAAYLLSNPATNIIITGGVYATNLHGEGANISNITWANITNANSIVTNIVTPFIANVNGNLANTDANVANLVAALANTDANVVTINANLTNVWSNITVINSNVANLDANTTANLTNVWANITSTNSNVANTDANVANLVVALANTDANVANLASSNTAIWLALANTDSNVANVTANVGNAWIEIGNINSNAANTDANVANAWTEIGNINTNVANTDGNVVALGNSVSNIWANIISINANVANTDANIANLMANTSANFASVLSDIANTNANVANTDSNVANLWIETANINSNVANTDSNVANLVLDTSANLTNVWSNITVLQGNVSNIDANLTNVWSNIVSTNSNLANTDANVVHLWSNTQALMANAYSNVNAMSLLNSGNVINVIATTFGTGFAAMTITGNTIGGGNIITIDPANDNSPTTGEVVVLGNLSVTGNVTYLDVSTAITSNLQWIAAATANSAVSAWGAGLSVGDPNNSPIASWLYDAVANSWTTILQIDAASYTGDGGKLSNICWGNIYAANANIANYIPTDPSFLMLANDNIIQYAQIANTNANVANTNANVANLVSSSANIILELGNINANISNTDANVSNLITDISNTNANVANTDSNVANLTTALALTDGNVANVIAGLNSALVAIAGTNSNVANTDSNVGNLVVALANTDSNVANTISSIANTDSNLANTDAIVANLVANAYGNSNVELLLGTGVATDILPAAPNTYSLGSNTMPWRSLYVASNTIYLDAVPLGAVGNVLTFDGGNLLYEATFLSAFADVNSNVANTDSNVGNLVVALANTDSNVANIVTEISNINSNVANTDSNVGNIVLDTANIWANIAEINSNVGNTDANVGNALTLLATVQADIVQLFNDDANIVANVAILTTDLANTNANLANTDANVANVWADTQALIANAYSNVNAASYLASGNIATDIITSGNVNANNVNANALTVATFSLFGNAITSTGNEIIVDPLGDGNPLTGEFIVLGNLSVAGNISYNDVTTAVTTDLQWVAANNANTPAAAAGGGLLVGPATAPYASWTYDEPANAWLSNIDIIATGFIGDGGHLSNISWANIPGANTIVSSIVASAPEIVAINSNVANTDSNVSNAFTAISSTNSNVANTDSNVSTLVLDVASVNSNVANTDSNVGTLTITVGNVNSDLANTTANLGNAWIEIANINANVANISFANVWTEIGNINSNVANTDSNVGNLVVAIANTDANVANVFTDISNVNANVASTDSNVGNLIIALANTDANVANAFSDISNLVVVIGNTDANVANTDANVANAFSDIGNLTVALANTDSNVGNITVALANTDSNVANAFSDIANLQANVYSNANVDAYLPTYTGNITGGNISVTGNIEASFFVGNGQFLTGLDYLDYDDANVKALLESGNISNNIITTGHFGGNLLVGNDVILLGTGANVWTGTVSGATTYAGFFDATTAGSQLITFASQNGQMSIQADGSLFVGDGLGLIPYGIDATAPGFIVAEETVYAKHVSVAHDVTAVGSVVADVITANYFHGDGSNISNIQIANGIANGNSNIVIPLANSGIKFFVNGVVAGSLTAQDNVNFGSNAGLAGQVSGAVAIGNVAGRTNQAAAAVAVGQAAGEDTQGEYAVAIGAGAGSFEQGAEAVAVGDGSGNFQQGAAAVAIGYTAGSMLQHADAIAIGSAAGQSDQGDAAVAIGLNAGQNSQGANAIAIGHNAGVNQAADSIILNATGVALDSTASGLYVSPVRNDLTNIANVVYFNDLTNELTYAPVYSTYSDANVSTFLASGNTFNANIDGTVTAASFIGDGGFLSNINAANIVGTVANANVVTDNAQPNITSVGTLTSLSVSGNIEVGLVTGNLIPDANVTYSLGSNTAQWKDLWLSNATLYLDGIGLSSDANSVLTWNGNSVVTTDSSDANTTIASLNSDTISVSGNVSANVVVLGNSTVTMGVIDWVVNQSTSTSGLILYETPEANATGVDFFVTATSGADCQISKLLAVAHGGGINYIEYGSLTLGNTLADFQVLQSGSNVRLVAFPASSTPTDYRVTINTHQ